MSRGADGGHPPAVAIPIHFGHDLAGVLTHVVGDGKVDKLMADGLVDYPAEGALDSFEGLPDEGVQNEDDLVDVPWDAGQVDQDGFVVGSFREFTRLSPVCRTEPSSLV